MGGMGFMGNMGGMGDGNTIFPMVHLDPIFPISLGGFGWRVLCGSCARGGRLVR